MKDPFGTVLVLVRDAAAVQAIVGSKVSDVAESPPSVRIDMGDTLRAVQPGSERAGMQQVPFNLFCYGLPNDPAGPILARQLAGVVSDTLHGLGPVRGTNDVFIHRIWAPAIGPLLVDPDTKWPYHTVRAIAYAAAQAVTL